ncbi:MAG TPA: CapA family protein [Kofleriaceae bacterium]|nr:CapA family protein [Kofleriaceae bacterium]
MTGRLFCLVLAAACGGAAPESSAPPAAPSPRPPDPAAPAAPAGPPAAPPGEERAERIELTFMGDVMFGGTFSGRFVPQDAETHDPLSEIEALIASDLPLANLETTVVKEIPVASMKGNLRFAATPGQVATLPRHGIKTVTLANNHANDLDGAGLAETPAHLRELGIQFIGGFVHEPPVFRAETIEVKGWKLGFVAATTKLNRPQKPGDPVVPLVDIADLQATLVPVVKDARAGHDLVIVVLHWGTQYAEAPSPEQVAAARAFIDAGADAVVGHHPHILQAIERYRDGLIAYSLGNFVFQNTVPGQRDTGVLRLGFSRGEKAACLDLAAFQPAIIRGRPVHHPVPAVGAEFDAIAAKVQRLSSTKPFATRWKVGGDRLTTAAAGPAGGG